MACKLGVVVEDHVVLGVEAQFGQPLDADAPGLLDLFQHLLGGFGIIILGRESGEAEDRRAVGGMAHPGKGETAMQRGAQPGKLERRCEHLVQETPRRHHRPHGMRRRRADTHFKHVEDGKKHQVADPFMVAGVGARWNGYRPDLWRIASGVGRSNHFLPPLGALKATEGALWPSCRIAVRPKTADLPLAPYANSPYNAANA